MAYGNEDDNFAFKPDSVQLVDASELKVDTLPQVAWRPDAIRAVWLGAIFPGLGQMYNRSWWKVPIVYGALMGGAYRVWGIDGLRLCYHDESAVLHRVQDSLS